MTITALGRVGSTNKYCEALDPSQVEDFACFWAEEQTAGIGQRGNSWHSSPRQNLTFSLILKPLALKAKRQFVLTQALSLGVCDFLETELSDIREPLSIKWPNDIYVGKSKICGTLMSARLVAGQIASAVCGVGLNVNERQFPEWVPNPTSLALLTGQTYNPEALLPCLLACMQRRYEALHQGSTVQDEYLARLYRRGVPSAYTYKGQPLRATIEGVDEYGRLLMRTSEGSLLCCNNKEVVF